MKNPTWANLVHTGWAVGMVDGLADVAGQKVGGSRARSESENSVDGGFERTGVPLDLGEEEAPLDSGEEGDGEVVGLQAGPQVPGGVKCSQPVADGR